MKGTLFMGTAEIIEARRARDYERYEQHRRFEESTDIAERLGYPIDLRIAYEMRDGAAYALSDTKDRPFHEQTAQALSEGAGKFTGSQAFEVTRLSHEHDEALMIDAFGRGELPGNVIIKVSKVPDAVVRGTTDINGYRRDLLRSFVRIYSRSNSSIECRLFTLDHNNSDGFKAVGRITNMDLARGSEDILADHTLINVPATELTTFCDEMADTIKLHYDAAVYQSTHIRTHAGSQFIDHHDAMSAVATQPRLFHEHLRTLDKIKSLGLPQAAQQALEEEARKKIAAAIKLSSEGVSIDSVGDASVTAEVSQGHYGGECATAPNGMNQAQLLENKWTKGECVACLRRTSVGSCSVCRDCEAADNRGIDLLKVREKSLEKRIKRETMKKRDVLPTPQKQVKQTKQEMAKARYGEYAMFEYKRRVGGADYVVYDSRTQQVIGKL